MKKASFLTSLSEMVTMNIIEDGKIEYFLVCNVTENDERIYIYFLEEKEDNVFFKLETPFKDYDNISIDDLINFLDKHYLNENKKTYCFYVSLLEK